MHYKRNWQGILSICRKSGRLAMGLEPAKDALVRGTAAGLLMASDASEKSKKEAYYFSAQAQVPCLTLPLSKGELGQYIGRACAVLAVCDEGFMRRMQAIAAQDEADNGTASIEKT